jgi:hypothetical protein
MATSVNHILMETVDIRHLPRFMCNMEDTTKNKQPAAASDPSIIG